MAGSFVCDVFAVLTMAVYIAIEHHVVTGVVWLRKYLAVVTPHCNWVFVRQVNLNKKLFI